VLTSYTITPYWYCDVQRETEGLNHRNFQSISNLAHPAKLLQATPHKSLEYNNLQLFLPETPANAIVKPLKSQDRR
jgi:hypothetical protein